mmetsp:Transcript_7787/g.18169  ORF Transcript_7787/g.18169 Transcript_7787/m.18169 type:complete len:373 (-) Transcript_7787:596-1714(-)
MYGAGIGGELSIRRLGPSWLDGLHPAFLCAQQLRHGRGLHGSCELGRPLRPLRFVDFCADGEGHLSARVNADHPARAHVHMDHVVAVADRRREVETQREARAVERDGDRLLRDEAVVRGRPVGQRRRAARVDALGEDPPALAVRVSGCLSGPNRLVGRSREIGRHLRCSCRLLLLLLLLLGVRHRRLRRLRRLRHLLRHRHRRLRHLHRLRHLSRLLHTRRLCRLCRRLRCLRLRCCLRLLRCLRHRYRLRRLCLLRYLRLLRRTHLLVRDHVVSRVHVRTRDAHLQGCRLAREGVVHLGAHAELGGLEPIESHLCLVALLAFVVKSPEAVGDQCLQLGDREDNLDPRPLHRVREEHVKKPFGQGDDVRTRL